MIKFNVISAPLKLMKYGVRANTPSFRLYGMRRAFFYIVRFAFLISIGLLFYYLIF
jgi:hypothetical protein